MTQNIRRKVEDHLEREKNEEDDKRKKWASSEADLQKMLGQLRSVETVVTVANPDKVTNSQAEEAVKFIEKVTKFIQGDHYAAAESLLRHIYRISPSRQSRTPLAAARRLCHEAVIMENKWVRRRATLRRRGEDVATIRAEKKKYSFTKEQRQQIADLLATAVLEISEGVEKRGGHYYTKLQSMFEVILPPSSDEVMTFVKAPVMFNAKGILNERDFLAVMHRVHDLDPGLKRIERGFFICRSIPLVGFKVKLDTPGRMKKASDKLNEQMRRKVHLFEHVMVHHSSKLFWYAYDFPVEVTAIHFADHNIVENYGEFGQTSLLEMDNGKLSRDEFVKLREETRRRVLQLQTMNLRAQREQFMKQHESTFQTVSALEDAAQEITELMEKLRLEFSRLTATVIDDVGKGNGLAISQYKRLYHHSRKMYQELVGVDESERDRLREQLFHDRLRARIMVYEYRDLVARRAQFMERIELLRGQIANMRDIARGSGKNLQINLE